MSESRPKAAHFDTGIVGTAFKTRYGVVLTLPRPARHCHYWSEYNEDARKSGWDFPWKGWSAKKLRRSEQGFITHDGLFVGREEAGIIALREKQIEKLNWPNHLYSEDLW